MTAILVALTPEFADWECALLMAVARSYLGVTVRTATADGGSVVSMGGLRVAPDLAFGDVKPQEFDAIVVPGGLAWEKELVPDTLHDLVRLFRSDKKMTAGICAAASMVAGAGILNDVSHTGNRLGRTRLIPPIPEPSIMWSVRMRYCRTGWSPRPARHPTHLRLRS